MADVIEHAGACRRCGEPIIVCPHLSAAPHARARCTAHEHCEGFMHADLFHGCDPAISPDTVAAPRLRQMQEEVTA